MDETAKSLESLERKVYTFDEAFEDSKKYFGGDELAAKVWVNKYALKDSKANIYESNPDQMHQRLAKEISRIEQKYPNPLPEEKIYSLLKDFRYIIPQGSPMSGIGNNYQVVSLSNCFVIGNESDSYGGIMTTDQEQVQLMKRRGGVGHDLSHLRPKGGSVENSALNSTGVASFMERYSNSTREVAQDGRRGALMLSLSIKHPDAEDFIDAKMTSGKVTGANVSVRVDDEFMESVRDSKLYVQRFPVNSNNPSYGKEINPQDIWEKIIHNAWKFAEPGVLFWDTLIRESVPDVYSDLGFKTTSTNPCGEIPLCIYDSCRLLAKNLYSYVVEPFTDKAKFNWDLFKENVGYAQRIMDDIVDLEIEKIDRILKKIDSDPENEETKHVEKNLWEKIREKSIQGRRTGVGITAEGDMLAALGLTYGSEEATNFSVNVHKTLALEAYKSSVNMAKERGSFKIYDSSREENNPFIQRIREADGELYNKMVKYGRRNIALLTIAPTGTVSLMTQTTSGLEQIFSPNYIRRRKVNPNDKDIRIDFVDELGDSWEEYPVFHKQFETWLGIKGYDIEKVKKVAYESRDDPIKKAELEGIIKESPYYMATSQDVDWVSKVRMQGAVQKWVDHSISVTVNLPEDISEETVKEVYRTAWEVGCKGITVYREGSRSGILLTGNENKISKKDLSTLVMDRINQPRPENILGRTEKVDTPYEQSAFVTFNWENDERGNKFPYETFIGVGKAGGDLPAIAEGFGRLISLALKAGINPNYIIDQLRGLGGETQQGFGRQRIKSLPDAIAKGITKILEKEGEYSVNENKRTASENLCPEGHPLIMSEGCEICSVCDYTKC